MPPKTKKPPAVAVKAPPLDLLKDVCDPKSGIPVLTHVLARGGLLTATDMEVAVEVPVPTGLDVQGEGCFPLAAVRRTLDADAGDATLRFEEVPPPAVPPVPERVLAFIEAHRVALEDSHATPWAERDRLRKAFEDATGPTPPQDLLNAVRGWYAAYFEARGGRVLDFDKTAVADLRDAIRVAYRHHTSPVPPEHFVHVATPDLNSKLVAIPLSDWPAVPVLEERFRFSALLTDFCSALRAVLAAASTDETRYNMNGVFFEMTADAPATLVATDGHRLHITSLPLHQQPETVERLSFIFPRKLAEILAKRVAPAPDELIDFSLRYGEETDAKGQSCLVLKHIGVQVGAVRWTVRAIDGQYPDYRQVVPADADLRWCATLDADALRAGLTKLLKANPKSASSLAACLSLAGQPEARLSRGESTLKAPVGVVEYAAPPEVPEEVETTDTWGETTTKPNPAFPFYWPTVVGFNAAYMLDALDALPGATRVHLRGGASYAQAVGWKVVGPMLLTDAAGGDTRIIVAPMRT